MFPQYLRSPPGSDLEKRQVSDKHTVLPTLTEILVLDNPVAKKRKKGKGKSKAEKAIETAMDAFMTFQTEAEERFMKSEEERWKKEMEQEEKRRKEDREHEIRMLRMLGNLMQGGYNNSYSDYDY